MNKIAHIAFPLTESTYPDRFVTFWDDHDTIPEASVFVDYFKKAVEARRESEFNLLIDDTFSAVCGHDGTPHLQVVRHDIDSEWAEALMPETSSVFSCAWLLDELKKLEDGAEFTDNTILLQCPHSGSRIMYVVYYGGGTGGWVYEPHMLYRLLKDIGNASSSLVEFYDLLECAKGDGGAELVPTPRLKRLLADIRLKGAQDTPVGKMLEALSEGLSGGRRV